MTSLRPLTRLSVLAALVLFPSCAKKEVPPVSSSLPVVRLQPVAYSAESVPVRAPGVLSRVTEAELSFKIGGVVQDVPVRAGDVVKAGDVLAKLRLDEIDAQVVQARSGLEKAQRDFERLRRLQEGNVATKENAQDAETAVRVAEASLRVAEFNRVHAVITAPADGRILRRLAEPNEIVGPGQRIVSFASDAQGWLVRVGLSERDAARLKPGDPAVIGDPPGDGRVARGQVSHIAETADPATRTTEVEVTLPSPPDGSRSGYVVPVHLLPAPVAERPVVPASALIEGMDRQAFLFLVESGRTTVRRLQVSIGEIDRERVFLASELPRDARIVVTGAEFLRDGSEFEAVKE